MELVMHERLARALLVHQPDVPGLLFARFAG